MCWHSQARRSRETVYIYWTVQCLRSWASRHSTQDLISVDNESVQNYLIRLRSGARDGNFICSNCDHGLSNIYIKDQFIRVIAYDALQADMLAKAESLKTLEQILSHAEAFETTMRDQNKISGISDIAGLRTSAYYRQKPDQPLPTTVETQLPRNMCRGCSSYQHSRTGSGDRPWMFPAWSQTYRACDKQNHFEKGWQSKGGDKPSTRWCFEDEEASRDALIAYGVYLTQ